MEGSIAWWKEKQQHLFTLFTFSNKFYLNLQFFFWSINYNRAFQCNKSSTPCCRFDFDWRCIFLSLIPWCRVWPHLTGLKLHKWTKNRLRNHLYICPWHNILVMKIPNLERYVLVLKLNPLKPGTITFLLTLAPRSSCCKSTPLLLLNSKPSMKIVTKLKTLLLSHGFQFSTLETIIVVWPDSSTTS
jgi:hypothetical protein